MLSWKELTPEEQQAWHISWEANWCWAKGSFIRPPYWIFFKASCDIHDWGYKNWKDEKDRKEVDKWFLKYMLQDVRRLPFYKRPKYYVWAHLYYYAVRIFWKNAFYANKK